MHFWTADLCDELGDKVQVADDIFRSFGRCKKFSGEVVTIELDEDNRGLIELLKSDGDGKVAVVDVKAKYVAVVGENLALLAHKNGWRGLVINGYVRDTHIIKEIDLGILALGTCPKRSSKISDAKKDIELNFANIAFRNGQKIYVDNDGIVVI